MVMNDLLPPPLCNVNRPSHSEIQQFQNLTMKIHGQGHVCGQKSRWHLTFNIQRSRSWSRSNPLVTFEAWSSINMFAFRFVAIGPFWLRYSKFHIWPWRFKVKVTTKIDQNVVRQSIGQGQQSCQKWKKSNKLFKSYRVNKNLRPAAYEPVQKYSHPRYIGVI